MDIYEMKVARFRFLNHLFELTGGDEMKWYKEEIIAKSEAQVFILDKIL